MGNVLPFLRLISSEPSTNFRPGPIDNYETEQELYSQAHDHYAVTSSETSGSKGRMTAIFKFLVAPTKPKPITIHGLEDTIWDEVSAI